MVIIMITEIKNSNGDNNGHGNINGANKGHGKMQW